MLPTNDELLHTGAHGHGHCVPEYRQSVTGSRRVALTFSQSLEVFVVEQRSAFRDVIAYARTSDVAGARTSPPNYFEKGAEGLLGVEPPGPVVTTMA
jgi:hypothetical protein